VEVATYRCDVSDETAVTATARLVELDMGAADILINNAGIGYLGRFLDTDLAAWRRVLDINVMGVVQCTRAFVPAMLAAGGSRSVVNLSSALGFSPGVALSAYSASKHAVVGLSEVLALELADTPVNVLIVAPGIINTNIVSSPANIASSITTAQVDRLQAYYREKGCLPDVVAEGIVRAVQSGQAILAIGPSAKAVMTLMRVSRRLARRVIIAMSKKIGFA
jgi:short-subunit dehydrogenase